MIISKSYVIAMFLLKKLGFIPGKDEQPLRSMELQEKEWKEQKGWKACRKVDQREKEKGV